MFKLMDGCMLTFAVRTVDVCVRANINVVTSVCLCSVCVCVFVVSYSWV